VPGTLTTFDWTHTDYTHTPAARHEDLTALATLPKAAVTATAAMESVDGKRVIAVHLANSNDALAFQLHAAVRSAEGELIAPVFWSDNWLELVPGESTTLTAEIPDDARDPVVELDGWNIAPTKLQPIAVAH
jgi:exo-1,4-beta-D-glucosaminidase